MTLYKNELHTSQNPYLLQHQHNPVAWKRWGDDAFSEARQRNVPLLVSIGYSTCHWCHVMAHEVFENNEAADMMNETLVCIKVDREEHPEVDEVYMEACQKLNGSGGWPLNVFLDQSGNPFFAATYVPLESWKSLLQRVRQAWTDNRTEITGFAQQLTASLSEETLTANDLPVNEINQKLFDYLIDHFDEKNPDFSGAGRAPRFPSHALFYHLLSKRNVPKGIAQKLEKTMESIQDSGIHDLAGGGFHRYSTDKEWRVPHFEKMLYDNAQLMMNFALASGRLNRPDFLTTAERTANYLIRDLSVFDDKTFAGFASAEDADDPLGEGTFYAWTASELKKILGFDLGNKISTLWNITDDNTNIHGVYPFRIPHPRGSSDFFNAGSVEKQLLREKWLSACDRLLEHRSKRPRPFRDTKVLTDWNALVLMGLSVLYAHSPKEKYGEKAIQLAEILLKRIKPTHLDRIPGKPGHVTDYGHTALALFTAWEVFGNAAYFEGSESLIRMAFDKFTTKEGNVYTSDSNAFVLSRFEEKYDHAQPAGAHSLLLAWVRMNGLGKMSEYQSLVEKILKRRLTLVSDYPVMNPFLVSSLNEWQKGPVTLGLPEHFRTKFRHLLQWTGSDMRIIENQESSTFQLCENDHCLLPVSSIGELEKIVTFSWQ